MTRDVLAYVYSLFSNDNLNHRIIIPELDAIEAAIPGLPPTGLEAPKQREIPEKKKEEAAAKEQPEPQPELSEEWQEVKCQYRVVDRFHAGWIEGSLEESAVPNF